MLKMFYILGKIILFYRLEDVGVDGRKWDVGVWTGSSWLRIGTGDGHL
jgi:hypothetical protein